MILVWLLIILIAGGLLAWPAGARSRRLPPRIALTALVVDLVLILQFWFTHRPKSGIETGTWLMDFQVSWIPSFGIDFYLAMDGLSMLLLALTFLLGIAGVLVSWTEIRERTGFYYFNLLWILAGITGVFLAMDLFLFYFFWELMLIPMVFLIGIWGHERRRYAAYKFFLFTQASGLLMFLGILALYFIHGEQSGQYTFNYQELLGTEVSPAAALWLLGSFLIAFLVKLPAIPLHSWLPDAHTEAPTAGSVILAGLLLKTGAYGMLRFAVPLFPEAARKLGPFMMVIGVAGILYGAKLAFAQTDLKRLVAYSSISHMGFVLLGIFAFNVLAYQGVVMQLLAHGISTGALFILAGAIQERIHTRELDEMGGLWERAPAMGSVTLIFVMASLGLPGLGNFVAEFLILLGTWQTDKLPAAVAALGLVASAIYALRIMQRVFYGAPASPGKLISDLNGREWMSMGAMLLLIFWLGLYPQPFLESAEDSLQRILIEVAEGVEESTSQRQPSPEEQKLYRDLTLSGKDFKTNAE